VRRYHSSVVSFLSALIISTFSVLSLLAWRTLDGNTPEITEGGAEAECLNVFKRRDLENDTRLSLVLPGRFLLEDVSECL